MKINPTIRLCLTLAALIALFYWKYFFPSQFTLLDGAESVRQAYSWFHFWMSSVRDGYLPAWDPYSFCGHSFPGEMQTGAFYPLYLLLFLFPSDGNGMLSSMQYNIIILSARVLAALFMFALARELKLSRFAAFVSSFCFSAGAFVGGATWPHMLQSSIWLPLIFLFLLRSGKATSRQQMVLYSLLSGSCLGLSLLAGGLHIAIAQTIVVLTALAFSAAHRNVPFEREDAAPHAWRRAGIMAALILGTGLCAAAVQLLPSHLYAGHSIRFVGSTAFPSSQMLPYMYVAESFLSPAGIMSVLFPVFEGMGQGETWAPYIGVLPFALAVIAIVKSWSHLWVRYLLGLSLAALLFALAGASALHGVLYALVPWLWMAREGTRFLYLTGFGLAILAGFGIDVLSFRLETDVFWASLRRVLFWISIGCIAALCLSVLFPHSGSYWGSFSVLMILGSCALLRFVLLRNGPPERNWRLLAVGIIFFDLYAFNWSTGNKIVADRENRNNLEVLKSLQGTARFLKSRPQPFRINTFRDPQPSLGDAYGIQDTSGGGVTFETGFSKVRLDYDLLNVRYFIKPASANDPAPVYQDSAWKVYENPRAFPRSWLVHDVRLEPDEDTALNDLHSGRIDPHQTALLTTPLPRSIQAGTPLPNETVSIRSYSPNRITAVAHSGSAALLVFSELCDPEWYATVNGTPATIYRANGAFRSVLVPPGDSTVELRYRPWSIYIGALLSIAAFLATFAVLFSAWRTARISSSPHRAVSSQTAAPV